MNSTEINRNNLSMKRVEAFLKMSHQMMTQYHERRNLEWRVHILLWTLLVVGAYFIIKTGMNVHLGIFVFILVIIFIIHIIWTLKMQLGEIRDQNLSIQYRELAENEMMINIPQQDVTKATMPSWLRNMLRSYWFWNAIVFVTTALMCIGFGVLTYSVSTQKTDKITSQTRMQCLELQLEKLQKIQHQDHQSLDSKLNVLQNEFEALRQKSSAFQKSFF